jgi:acyl-CoA dehydrogenase
VEVTIGPPTGEADAVAKARLVAKILKEDAAQVDATASFPLRGMTALRESGLLGLLIPSPFGGYGSSLETFVAVAEELSAACLSTGLIWAMHSQQAVVLAQAATPALQERLLPRVAQGEVYLASVTSERGKGGHLLTATQPLTTSSAGLDVVRDAPVVTGGAVADGFVITMRSAPEAAPTSVSLVYVDRSQAEVVISGGWDPLGMRATQSLGLHITAQIPADQLVGGSGQFSSFALHPFITVGHIGWAACWLGAARGVFREFIRMLRSPQQRKRFAFGEDLFGVRLARVRLALDTVGAFLTRVVQEAAEIDRTGGDPAAPAFQLHVNGLKVVASETLFDAVSQLMELSGLGNGYLRNEAFPLERVFRDLRSASMNYANDRLLVANGWLAALDRDVILP